MVRSRWAWIGGASVVLIVGTWLFLRPGRDRMAIDLLAEFPHAKQLRPSPDTFKIVDARLGNDTRKAIFTNVPSRIIWHVTIPNNAWLRVGMGLLEEAWTVKGDGVLFQMGVSDGEHYTELLSLDVNPYSNASDRRWQDVLLDLSPYAGKAVDLIFNTYNSPPSSPGGPPRDDRNGDLAVWGTPRIVVR
jgi:hypothetical protein